LQGEVDAGMVRTDTLERMASAGKIDPKQLRVLNQQQASGFPFALSTRLYPEWPFAKVRHTSDELAQKVAVALLSMPPDHPAARASKSAGWTVPLDYTPVHELYKELRVGPYRDYGKVTFVEVLKHYWYWLAVVFGVILLLGLNTGYILKLNRGLKQSQTRLLEITHQLEQLAILDGLTGIHNHRYFQEHLNKEWRRALRNKQPVSLIMIDIDFFKNFNDSYGHPTGDECLKKVAQALQQSVNRPGDLVARYGGEEFVAVLPEVGAEGAALIAERMRKAVEALKFPHRESRIAAHVTVSLGVASFVPTRESAPDALIGAADKALYAAKEAGRNRTHIAKAA
jgi:diguanylate cyclase (GGDEF)-like protein